MKRFILNFVLFTVVPLLVLVLVYLITDPFKTIKPFDLKNVSTVNRDYLSTELFLKNNKIYHYDSFIFGSSRGCGLNTYLWKSYLPKGSQQFLFQAWCETITGIYQKIDYLDKHNQRIRNVIILIDVPGTFLTNQEPHEVMTIKHPLFSGMSWLKYQSYLFRAFLQPSEVIKSISDYKLGKRIPVNFDTISNDWESTNIDSWQKQPMQNSSLDKSKFGIKPKDETFSTPQINESFEKILENIYLILKKHHTSYKIVVSPAYDQVHINVADLHKISSIFGAENVYNFSGKNKLTTDKYNFMDLNHFDLNVGWEIINTCYDKSKSVDLKCM